jgi:soluble lytic murein transglycosylase-like protein
MNLRLFLCSALLALVASAAQAQLLLPGGGGASPAAQCRAAIRAAEQAAAIPDQLLAAIGRVESGRRDPATGQMAPWPWTINAEGQGYVFDTKAQAISAVQALQAQGVRSIDVGCLQVNLMYHPEAFASLDAAFDPRTNANYAARFLVQLYGQTNDWNKAAANYHSANPDEGASYQRKVLAVWPEEKLAAAGQPLGGESPRSALASAWAATMPTPTHPAVPGGSPMSPMGRFAVQFAPAHTEVPHIVALPNGAPPGRSLASYRSMPVFAVSRPMRIGG